MAKCVVCGKKSLFLRVNYAGRCKVCEEEYQKERERVKQKELEIELAKKENAKKMLIQIIDTYKVIDGYISKIKEVNNYETFCLEVKKYQDCYNKFNSLIEEAKSTDFFQDIMLQYVGKYDCAEKQQCAKLHLRLNTRYSTLKLVHAFQKEQFDSLMLELWLAGFDVNKEWERKKQSTEKLFIKGNVLSERKRKCSDIHLESFDIVPDCVVTDIETSGLIYNKNSIIEIAAVKIVGGKVVDTYSSLVHREKPLNSKVVALTGITTEILRNCDKDLETVITEYRDFVGDLPLVGHNIISFDIKFINEAYLKVFGKSIENPCIDTLKLSYEYFFDSESHKLSDLARFAGVPVGTAHRALGDCETTAYLYKCMLNIGAAILLKWSQKGKAVDTANETYPKYLTRQYPAGMCSEYHELLIELEYLIPAGVKTVLNAYKVPELKEILVSNNLSISGKKQDLIERITETVDIKTINIPVLYVPSEKGIAHMKEYENAFNEMVQNNRERFK